jgi:RNA polymerase sigma-70 factor (ECF subfamily)
MELSEDIVQEVFVMLWSKRDSIKNDQIIRFLYISANNLFIDNYRHQNVTLKLTGTNKQQNEMADSPEFLMEYKEFDVALQKAISSLSEKERTVFLMNRIDGLTYNEIAENMALSIKAVEKRMHNAVEKLYKKINRKL